MNLKPQPPPARYRSPGREIAEAVAWTAFLMLAISFGLYLLFLPHGGV